MDGKPVTFQSQRNTLTRVDENLVSPLLVVHGCYSEILSYCTSVFQKMKFEIFLQCSMFRVKIIVKEKLQAGHRKITNKLYTIPCTGILTSFFTNKLSPE